MPLLPSAVQQQQAPVRARRHLLVAPAPALTVRPDLEGGQHGRSRSFATLFVGADPMNSLHTDNDATGVGLICPVVL